MEEANSLVRLQVVVAVRKKASDLSKRPKEQIGIHEVISLIGKLDSEGTNIQDKNQDIAIKYLIFAYTCVYSRSQ